MKWFIETPLAYKKILSVAAPIMIGSAAQNIVALSDSIFLFHLSDTAFAAIGLCSVFYLTMVAIGYGFSVGGQITIARQMGLNLKKELGNTFKSILAFEIVLALLLFLVVRFGSEFIFSTFVHSDTILEQSLAFLKIRSFGLFLSFTCFAFIALYTGISRTRLIAINTVVLIVVNILLNYTFIFKLNMGIKGAAWASNCAELAAVFFFFALTLKDRKVRPYKLFRITRIDRRQLLELMHLSYPVVLQSLLGLVGWFFFFAMMETRGERALAISNLARIVYLILSVPIWGLASATNTLVSFAIGRGRNIQIPAIILKVAKISFGLTMLISLPMLLFPGKILYPLLGKSDMSLITETKPIFIVMILIMAIYSIGAVIFNGISGSGATKFGLKLQTVQVIIYLIWVYITLLMLDLPIAWAWSGEILYWILIAVFGSRFIIRMVKLEHKRILEAEAQNIISTKDL
ncbi:MAG: MATE family efflux transporter [Saprospiraceae bacterium]